MTDKDLQISLKCKHIYDLGDFVYDFEGGSEHKNFDNVKSFDYLDFIIFDLEQNILPWHPKYKDLNLLFKMCKLAEKPTLACGAGMALLVKYCATAGQSIQVLKTGSIKNIQKVLSGNPSKLCQLD